MMRKLMWMACVCVLVCLCMPAGAQDAENPEPTRQQVDVYLLAGQSNMAGSGRMDGLPEAWWATEGAQLYSGRDWQPLNWNGAQRRPRMFGPEIGFARVLRATEPTTPVYMIKFALGGQPLDAGWDGGSADGSSWVGPEPGPGRRTFYPGTSAEDPNVGVFYTQMIERAQAGMQALRDAGYEPTLRGIAWMQGEQDAKHEVSAGRYAESLALLKSRIEADLNGGESVPFVFGQVLPHDPPLARFTHRDLIRQRMAEADWRSGSDRAIDGVWMVPTEGMELMKDTVHYSTKGQLALGQAFGLEMLKAHRKAEK